MCSVAIAGGIGEERPPGGKDCECGRTTLVQGLFEGLVRGREWASVPVMRFTLLLATALAATVLQGWAGTPKQAADVSGKYDREFQIWVLKLQVAKTAAERNEI